MIVVQDRECQMQIAACDCECSACTEEVYVIERDEHFPPVTGSCLLLRKTKLDMCLRRLQNICETPHTCIYIILL